MTTSARSSALLTIGERYGGDCVVALSTGPGGARPHDSAAMSDTAAGSFRIDAGDRIRTCVGMKPPAPEAGPFDRSGTPARCCRGSAGCLKKLLDESGERIR